MYKYITIIFCLLTSIIYSQTLTDKAPWFTNKDLQCIAFYGDSVGWVADDLNIYGSTDGGIKWLPLSKLDLIKKIYPFSQTKLIAVNNLFLYYSENGGRDWLQLNSPLNSLSTFYPKDINTIFSLGENESIYRTVNRGVTWQLIHRDSSSSYTLNEISFVDTLTGFVMGNSGTNSKLLRTTDGGTTWISVANYEKYYTKMQFADSLIGYAANETDDPIDQGIHKSTDGGITWFLSTGGLYEMSPCNDLQVKGKDTIYASVGGDCLTGRNHLILSMNGGITWQYTNPPFDFNIKDMHVFANTLFIACGINGYIGKMTSWLVLTSMNGTCLSGIYSIGKSVFAAGGKNFYRSYDDGNTWEHFLINTLNNFIEPKLCFLNDSIGFIFPNGLRTMNGGETWDTITVPEQYTGGYTKFFAVDRYVYLWRNYNFYRTTDVGITWNLLFSKAYYKNTITFIDTLHGWATTGNEICRTANGGISWDTISYEKIDLIHFVNADSGWGFNCFNNLNLHKFYYTNNGGINWNLLSTINFPYNIYPPNVEYYFRGPGDMLILEWGDWDFCKEWLYDQLFYEETSSIPVKPLLGFKTTPAYLHMADKEHGWMVAGKHIYKFNYPQEPAGISPEINASNYNLSQNYPNPFNPTTSIRYSIPKEGKVELILYNILGSKVVTLVNENKSPGVYDAVLNGSNLPSGVYFYKMRTGSFTDTKKMILLR